MAVQRTPMTRGGYEKLKEELERLKRVERHAITQAIAEARAHGDLSENAEHHPPRERQSFLQGRIAALGTKGGVGEAPPMPTARVDSVTLFFEEAGAGLPLVFVHEFAGDYRSWRLQMGFFSRRYRTLAFNARGYPPSDVPTEPKAYSQDEAADDIRGLLDALGLTKAHVCGLSMEIGRAHV